MLGTCTIQIKEPDLRVTLEKTLVHSFFFFLLFTPTNNGRIKPMDLLILKFITIRSSTWLITSCSYAYPSLSSCTVYACVSRVGVVPRGYEMSPLKQKTSVNLWNDKHLNSWIIVHNMCMSFSQGIITCYKHPSNCLINTIYHVFLKVFNHLVPASCLVTSHQTPN